MSVISEKKIVKVDFFNFLGVSPGNPLLTNEPLDPGYEIVNNNNNNVYSIKFSCSLRWSHTHFICIPAVRIISFCVSFLSRVDELNKLAGLQCMGLHSSGW